MFIARPIISIVLKHALSGTGQRGPSSQFHPLRCATKPKVLDLLTLRNRQQDIGNYYDSSGLYHGFSRTSDGTITVFDPPESACSIRSAEPNEGPGNPLVHAYFIVGCVLDFMSLDPSSEFYPLRYATTPNSLCVRSFGNRQPNRSENFGAAALLALKCRRGTISTLILVQDPTSVFAAPALLRGVMDTFAAAAAECVPELRNVRINAMIS
jgi:hypothetical protein